MIGAMRRIGLTGATGLWLAAGVTMLGVWGFAIAPAHADTTITVTTTSDETTPGDGVCSLREALQYAAVGSNQDCAPGMTRSGTTTVVLPANPAHYVLSSELDPGSPTGPVVIVGQGTDPTQTTIDAAGNDRVFEVFNPAVVTLENLTVTGGLAHSCDWNPTLPPSECYHSGGAILNAGNLTLDHVVVAGNRTPNGDWRGQIDASPGGGIANWTPGVLKVTDSVIENNRAGDGDVGGHGGCTPLNGGAGGSGGGIANHQGSVVVINTRITNNAAGNGGGGGGGCAGGTGSPGGKYGGQGSAGGDGGRGGGIFNDDGGNLIVRGSTIDNNHAGTGGGGGSGGAAGPGSYGSKGNGSGGNGGGGGGILTYGSLSVVNTTIVSNTGGNGAPAGGCPCRGAATPGAGGSGGGILQQDGSSTTQEATISLNLAGQPGTASGNGRPGVGSGIGVLAGEFYEESTIVSQDDCAGTIGDMGYNLLFAGSGCPAASSGNPQLGNLQDNGGPTPTMALAPGSAAIDQVPLSSAGCAPIDQRGNNRPDIPGTPCDIGAYETAGS